MSSMEDSDSGGEDAHVNENSGPRSPSVSPSSSPSHSLHSASQHSSPRSPQSTEFHKSLGSPQSAVSASPRSPQSPGSPQSNASEQSGMSPHVTSSPIRSPDPQSPVSSRPSSPAELKSQSNLSEDEAQASGDDDDEYSGSHERDEETEEKMRSCDEDERKSYEGENIPELNIESEDEKQSEKTSSDHEMEQSGDEDDQNNMHVDSEADSKSGNEEQESYKKSPPPSPFQENKDNSDEEEPEASTSQKEIDDRKEKENVDSDSDAESEESEVGGLIADIFGESDEEEEFEGFKEDDIEGGKLTKESAIPKKEKKKRIQIMSDSEDENEGDREAYEGTGVDEEAVPESEDIPQEEEVPEGDERPLKKKKTVESDESDDDADRKMREDFVSDFELMMQRKKEENSKRRKRKDVDLISDSDDLIADIISQMRHAAEEDKVLNKQKKTATKKLKILPMVMSQLKKQDLKMAFIDQGVLNVIAEWLAPLPDRSLPHLNIREGMIKQLSDLPTFDQSLLKSSGIGRALMYLFKHPRETKENREKAGKLITEWARPIFNVTTNYHSLTKEEREQRDYEHVPKKKRTRRGSEANEEEASQKKDIEKDMTEEKTAIRPGDKGWVGRARVPMPSTKDYVNRPKWNVEMEFGRGPSKKPLNRIEKHMRVLQDKKRQSKQERAITISIEGRKMAI